MHILVTGGAGFIGSHFVKRLIVNHPEHQVVTLDALTYAGNVDNLEGIPEDRTHVFIEGDIRDQEQVEWIFNRYRVDAVVNFAAESHVDRSIQSPGVFVTTNVLGTQVLLDTATRHWLGGTDQGAAAAGGLGPKKFLQISTDEVYGSLTGDIPFTESDPLSPNNPYAASKAAADLLVRSYWKTYGLPVNITRSGNNYGPNQHIEKLIPCMIRQARSRKRLPVYGDGLQVREWLYVEDHCSALEKVLFHGAPGEIYNIGSGFRLANLAVVRRILELVGESETLIDHVQDRLGHDIRYGMDSGKIAKDLDWQAKTSFEEGLRRTVSWYCCP